VAACIVRQGERGHSRRRRPKRNGCATPRSATSWDRSSTSPSAGRSTAELTLRSRGAAPGRREL